MSTETELSKRKGFVVRVQEYEFEVVINLGSRDGVIVGDKFLIYALGEELFDPIDGESLGELEIVRGRGIVIHVQEKMATLRSMEHQSQHGSTKRIIREPGVGALSVVNSLFGNQKIEEIIPPGTVEMPFNAPTVGDLAKLF